MVTYISEVCLDRRTESPDIPVQTLLTVHH
jgi:hypothetical protein